MLVLRKDCAAEAELCEWIAKGFEVHGARAEELVALGGAHCDFAGFADEVFLNPVAHPGRLFVDVWLSEVWIWW
jgi:hypothetical protein